MVFVFVLIFSTGSARGVDLEKPLRDAYVDRGRVSQKHVYLKSIDTNVDYLEAGQSTSRLVILLHGMVFRAHTWKFTGTLDALANAG